MSAQSQAGRVLAAVKPMTSWTLQTPGRNLVVFLLLGPLSLPPLSFISYVTVKRCRRLLQSGKELREGGVSYHVLTLFY